MELEDPSYNNSVINASRVDFTQWAHFLGSGAYFRVGLTFQTMHSPSFSC